LTLFPVCLLDFDRCVCLFLCDYLLVINLITDVRVCVCVCVIWLVIALMTLSFV